MRVRSTHIRAVPIGDGRRLRPGQQADVDPENTDVRRGLEDQLLAPVEDRLEGATKPEVLAWVNGDPDKAAEALAFEMSRPESDRRSTLIDALEHISPNPDPANEED